MGSTRNSGNARRNEPAVGIRLDRDVVLTLQYIENQRSLSGSAIQYSEPQTGRRAPFS